MWNNDGELGEGCFCGGAKDVHNMVGTGIGPEEGAG